MRNIFKNLSYVAVLVLVLAACQKVGELPFYKQGTPGVLEASATTLAPKVEDSLKPAVTLKWTSSNHATSAGNVKYTIQVDSTGKNFANPFTKVITDSLSATLTNKEINRAALMKGYEPNKAVDLQIRIISSYANNNEPISSNAVALKYTPYRELVNYEFPRALRVAGSHQNWDPGTAPKIVDMDATGATGDFYDGYINFGSNAADFKLVKGNNWGAGDFGASNSTTLTNGGDNLKVSAGGIYRVTANTEKMTWSAEKINSWGIIGDATPNGWGGSTAMTLNPNGTYSITTALVGGKFLKFRANNDWAINMGDNKANGPDGVPEYNGDDIAIATSGNYVITLDLTLAGNYSYSIKKQ